MSKRTMIPLAVYKRHVTELTPKIFASFILALHRLCGMEYEDLVAVLAETQNIWQTATAQGIDVAQMCYEETEIDIISSVTAKEANVKGDEV